MVERVWFKPKRGVKIPLGRLDPGVMFPPEGALVVRDSYIEKRLHEGSGTLVDIEAERTAKDAAIVHPETAAKPLLPKKL